MSNDINAPTTPSRSDAIDQVKSPSVGQAVLQKLIALGDSVLDPTPIIVEITKMTDAAWQAAEALRDHPHHAALAVLQSEAPADALTQETYTSKAAELDRIFRTDRDDLRAHAAGEELLGLHRQAKLRGLTVDAARWDLDFRSFVALEERMELMAIDRAVENPPEGLIAAMQNVGTASSRLHAWRQWEFFCKRRAAVSGIPNPLTSEHAAGVSAIADSSKITSWSEVGEHLQVALDAVDPFLGHAFAKDDQRSNFWHHAVEGNLALERALNDLLRDVAPARTMRAWERLASLPIGCTPEFMRDLHEGMKVCARALTGDGCEVDRQDDRDDFRNAAGLCLIAGLGVYAVIAICSAPGMSDYWQSVAGLLRECLDEQNPIYRAKRVEYVKLVAEAHKMSGVPVGFLRLDLCDIKRLLAHHPLDQDNRAIVKPLRANTTMHLLKYARVKGRPIGSQNYELVVRYQGQAALFKADKGGGGPIDVVFAQKSDEKRGLLQLLNMPAESKKEQTLPGLAAAWVLRNTPCAALARLRVVGEDPTLIVNPNGVSFAAYPMSTASWLRAHHGMDGVATFTGTVVDTLSDIAQSDMVRYEWPLSGAGGAGHEQWKSTLPTGHVPAIPFSISLVRAFPNIRLPQDPVARTGYLALLDAVLTLNVLRDELRHGRWSVSLAKEFPFIGLLPATGTQGSGGSGKRGSEFNVGKSALATVLIEATRGQRWDSSMSTAGLEGGDVINRSATDAVRLHGFCIGDEFPWIQLSTAEDTDASGAFSANGICRWATGETNPCPVVRQNAPQLPLLYLSILGGKPYPRMRDDVVSRFVFIFLGVLTKDADVQAQVIDGSLARTLRLQHLAWLNSFDWKSRMPSKPGVFANWRFPVHAQVLEALHPGAEAGLDAAAAWMRTERARIGDEARSDNTETGNAGVLEHLVSQATEEMFADIFAMAEVGTNPLLAPRYIKTWDFYAAIANALRGYSIQSTKDTDPNTELRKLIGPKATARATTTAAKRAFDCQDPRVFFGRWTVQYVGDTEPNNSIRNNSDARMAGLELHDLHPELPVHRRLASMGHSDTILKP
jgi:hypothetical protein